MAATELPRRRFVTRHDVEDAAAHGRSIDLGERDVLTAEAAQRARDLGVRVESPGTGSGAGPRSGPSRGQSTETELRRAVRAAVVAELGAEPPGLDDVIDRVLRRRS
ncbi:MAG TPA: hypothetical protein VFJ28_03225 [Marmoricola sp.]|nr:hypothetical protein [Marmoricola sp.]